jgi:predicted lipoprotein with Yx(FWY)xxD motif
MGMKRSILPILAVVAALAATACGGSSSSNSSTASTGSSGSTYGSTASTPAPSTGGVAAIKTTSGDLGTFLTDAKGRTLYLWEADKGSSSMCSGACAQAWPPLTTTGAPQAGTGVKSSLLGTTKRSDGKLEVTYNGHPLYYFAGDTAPGKTAGQGTDGFGAEWYVVGTNGKKIDKDS